MKFLFIFCILYSKFIFAAFDPNGAFEINYELIDSVNRIYKIRMIEYSQCGCGVGNGFGYNVSVNSVNCGGFGGDTFKFLPIYQILKNPLSNYFLNTCPGTYNPCPGTGPCPGNKSVFGYIKYIYEGYIQFPKSCDQYILSVINDAPQHQILSNIVLYVNASQGFSKIFIDLSNGQHNSSASSKQHNILPLFCKNSRVNYSFNTIDPDGDSLSYHLINLESGMPIKPCPTCPKRFILYHTFAYYAPSYLHPTFDCGMSFNTQTGEYKFKPDSVQVSAIGVQINEYRNGSLIGYSQRTATFNVLESANCGELSLDSAFGPSCKLVQSHQKVKDSFGCYNDTYIATKLVFCENAPIEINFKVKNLQKKVVKIENYSGQGILSDRDTTVIDSMRDFRISWASPKAGNHYSAIEFNHCPDTGIYNNKFSNYITVPFKVIRTPRPSKDTIFYCAKGGSREIKINKLDTGITFDWSHHSGFTYSNTDSSIVKIALTHDTTYYIYYTYFGGLTCPTCNMIDTIVLKYVPDFNHTISPANPKVCINTGTIISINADSLFKPYTYNWSPIQQIFNPNTGLVLDSLGIATTSSIQIKPFTNKTYFVEITAMNGCTVRDSVNIQVVDSVPNIVGYAPKPSWCYCDTARIYALSNQYASCGLLSYPNYNPVLTVPLSVSTNSFPSKPFTDYPSVFGASQGMNVKHRILIKNSELKAIGIQGKNMRSFSLFTDTVIEVKYRKVKIWMSCSLNDSITAYVNPIQVFYRDSLILLSNIEYKFVLDQFGYNVSNDENLFIDFCFENDTSATKNSQFKTEITPFTSIGYMVSNTSICNQNNFTNFSNIRPVLSFDIRQPKAITPASVNWSPNISLNDNTISNPIVNRCASIQYIVTATTGLCQSTDTINIDVDSVSYLIARADTFICSSLPVQLYASFNANPLKYKTTAFQWTSNPNDTSLKFPQQINQTVRPNQTTTYILKMTGGACAKYDTVIITRGAPLSLSKSKKDATCSGANGIAIIKTNNGNAPFTYTWNPANINSDTIKNIISGKYKVTVQAADGCLGNDSIILNNIIQTPSISLSQQNVRCFNEANGNIKVKVNSSETGPFSYTWTPSKPNKDSIFGLFAGWYKISLLDTPSNCTAMDSIQITQPTKLTIDADSSDVLCFGNNTGTLTSTTTGGSPIYIYTWSNASIGNNANAINQVAGNYTVTVIDSKGCRDSNTTKINQPNKLVGSIQQSTNVKCYGDSNGIATISTIGGTRPYQYNWLTSSNQIDSSVNNLKSGTHIVIITDRNNCQDTVKNISIAQPDSLSIQIISYPAKCFGQNNGSAKAIVTGGNGGYTYLWSEGTSIDSIQNKTAGNYSITITDSKGCKSQANASIYQSDSLSSANNTADSVRCFGEQNGKAIVHILGGKKPYTFNWNTIPSQTDSIAINLKAGNYLSTSIDMNGCKRIDSFKIYEPQKLKIDSIQIDAIDCKSSAGGKINIIASGGNPGWQYSIGPSFQTSPIFANIDRGIYTATIQDNKGCKDTRVFAILQGKPIQINLQKTDATCIGIDNGMAWIQNIQGGLAPFIKTWSTGLTIDTIQNLSGKKGYTIKIHDALNCIQIDSVFIETLSDIQVQSTIKPITCYNGNDGEINITTSGGKEPYQYQWSTNETINPIKKLRANILYTLTVQDALGCVDTTSYVLKQVDSFYVDSIYYQAVTCPDAKNGWIKATVKGGTASNSKQYLFSLDSMRWQNDRLFLKLSGGNYTIYAIDANGCVAKRIANLFEPPRIQLSVFPADTIVKIGHPVQLKTIITSKDTINQNRFKYQWNPTEGLDCYDCANPISKVFESKLYTVKLNYNEGCMYEGKAFIDVEDGIFIPNAFSPNQRDANENETFKVYGENIQSTHIQIFNRWSEKVFEEMGVNASWNGYYHGDVAMQGVYSYHISITFIGGKKVEKNGSVTLLR